MGLDELATSPSPCPFCGGTNIKFGESGTGMKIYHIACGSCGIGQTRGHWNMNLALDAWNKRMSQWVDKETKDG